MYQNSFLEWPWEDAFSSWSWHHDKLFEDPISSIKLFSSISSSSFVTCCDMSQEKPRKFPAVKVERTVYGKGWHNLKVGSQFEGWMGGVKVQLAPQYIE